MPGFLRALGLQILRKGYSIIPIKIGDKAPGLKHWQQFEATPEKIEHLLAGAHSGSGVGILTGKISFFDIDAYESEFAIETQNQIETHIGFAPLRIGRAPKRGLMYRTENPFRKITSRVWIDTEGRECRLEVLGIGQQFVAHHIHPDTGKPYLWPRRGDNPESVPADELPIVTEEQARWAVDDFNQRAETRGWLVKRAEPKTTTTLPAPAGYGRELDEWGLGTDPLGLSDEELQSKVMAIPNEDWPYGDDGDTETIGWFKIIAGIAHETGKSPFGEALAREWSEQSPKHTDERFDKTWNSFGKGDQRPITARYLLRWAKVYQRKIVEEQLNDVLFKIDIARDLNDLKAAATEAKKIDVDLVDRARLIATLQRAARALGVTLGIRDAREMVRYDPLKGDSPDWLKGWVYLSHADRFFNLDTKEMITEKAFDNTYSRFTGDTSPSIYALSRIQIDAVYMAAYLPGEEPFFTMNGHRFANTYSERNVPTIPARLEGRDRENVEKVNRHFAHLFEDKRERDLFISWLAYIAQTKKRPNWAILLQGVEGDGKSFFGFLMAGVLGGDNVRTMQAKTLEAPHNAWAQGQLLTFIEEVRMIGHSRHDVLNSVKPLITNATIEIHPKNINPYTAPNTTAYLLATNFQNALPIDDNDSRYFILMSRWQSKAMLDEFTASHPSYYADLYGAVETSPGALLGWLKAYKLHSDFRANGRAPRSDGRTRMVEQNKSEEGFTLEDLIEAGRHIDICDDLVVVKSLREAMADEMGVAPQTRTIEVVLREAGFTYLGRVKIDGERKSVWSRRPNSFGVDATTRAAGVRRYLQNPL